MVAGRTLQDSTKLPNAALAAEKALRSALSLAGGRLLDSDSCLVLYGSFARHEMTEGSDYDWSLLIDGEVNNEHAAQAQSISEALGKAKLIQPGATGTFGNMVFSHDLVHPGVSCLLRG